MRAIPVRDQYGNPCGWMIDCPACECSHHFDSRWTFNGNQERPTFAPSMLVHEWPHEPTEPGFRKQMRCHSFVRDGRIQYLDDCTHAMKGQTVDLPDMHVGES